jgi:membrane protease YdiL (CAAX protease family)
MVHSSLADLGCLAVLRWLLHREGLRLRDLLALRRQRLSQEAKDSLVALGAVGLAGAVSSVLTRPFYPTGVPPLITIVRVPWWARAYGVGVWPIVWATTEELVYLDYVLPRLEATLGSTKLAAGLVVFFWGAVQHPALPALPERRHIAYRAVTALPPVAMQTMLYLRRDRRLPPLILAHWLADTATGVIVALQPEEQPG